MGRLSKNARDELKAKGLWRLQGKAKYEAEAELFASSAAEANKIVFREGFSGVSEDFFFTHDADCYTEAWCEVIEDPFSNPFPPEVNDPNYEDSFLPAQSFLLGSAFRVLESSGSKIVNFSEHFPEVPIPDNQIPFLKSIGEFEKGNERMVYPSVSSEVKSFLRAAVGAEDSVTAADALARSWLPVSPDDARFKFILSERLADFLDAEVHTRLDPSLLRRFLFTDIVPNEVEIAVRTLDNEVRQEVLKLFNSFKTNEAFFRLYGKPNALKFLKGLGLSWKNPHPDHLLMEKSVHQLLLDVRRILPAKYLQYRAPGVVPLFSITGPGSPVQCVEPGGDLSFHCLPGTSVEEVVSSVVFRTAGVIQRGCPKEQATLLFDPKDHFRRLDVDWFDYQSMSFT
jgi:hypothetical protein